MPAVLFIGWKSTSDVVQTRIWVGGMNNATRDDHTTQSIYRHCRWRFTCEIHSCEHIISYCVWLFIVLKFCNTYTRMCIKRCRKICDRFKTIIIPFRFLRLTFLFPLAWISGFKNNSIRLPELTTIDISINILRSKHSLKSKLFKYIYLSIQKLLL